MRNPENSILPVAVDAVGSFAILCSGKGPVTGVSEEINNTPSAEEMTVRSSFTERHQALGNLRPEELHLPSARASLIHGGKAFKEIPAVVISQMNCLPCREDAAIQEAPA
ncbi:hypothetical protein DUI87_13160 [Hirundo rustica rustica]|uniref:Uncharacterized protein n=1 Tax=Hirundo rustica rustica TaxID=333673 RepID=A0A3M0KT91_HIRRU|nr:hypothetical protein DUI87_13160 [Hirundo rustica rustica]